VLIIVCGVSFWLPIQPPTHAKAKASAANIKPIGNNRMKDPRRGLGSDIRSGLRKNVIWNYWCTNMRKTLSHYLADYAAHNSGAGSQRHRPAVCGGYRVTRSLPG
jgi:hypothetical protein